MSRKTKSKPITLALPDEFIALCASDGVAPELVLRGFIADLAVAVVDEIETPHHIRQRFTVAH